MLPTEFPYDLPPLVARGIELFSRATALEKEKATFACTARRRKSRKKALAYMYPTTAGTSCTSSAVLLPLCRKRSRIPPQELERIPSRMFCIEVIAPYAAQKENKGSARPTAPRVTAPTSESCRSTMKMVPEIIVTMHSTWMAAKNEQLKMSYHRS